MCRSVRGHQMLAVTQVWTWTHLTDKLTEENSNSSA